MIVLYKIEKGNRYVVEADSIFEGTYGNEDILVIREDSRLIYFRAKKEISSIGTIANMVFDDLVRGLNVVSLMYDCECVGEFILK